jgi:hypothetical protein
MTQSHWLTPDDNEAPWRNDIKGGMYYVEGGRGGGAVLQASRFYPGQLSFIAMANGPGYQYRLILLGILFTLTRV